MKERIRTDSAILGLAVLLSGLWIAFPQFYSTSRSLDYLLSFLGMTAILKGAYIRMAARGHKKAHSFQGAGLVMTGLYGYSRNPMYLGSFLIGLGFVLIIWPWWTLPLYIFLFYFRFRRQIKKEEKYLLKKFGRSYESYCARVPRIFPKFSALVQMDVGKTFPWQEIWITKEPRTLWTCSILAVIFKTIQHKIVFGTVSLGPIILIFLAAAGLFITAFFVSYHSIRSHGL